MQYPTEIHRNRYGSDYSHSQRSPPYFINLTCGKIIKTLTLVKEVENTTYTLIIMPFLSNAPLQVIHKDQTGLSMACNEVSMLGDD